MTILEKLQLKIPKNYQNKFDLRRMPKENSVKFQDQYNNNTPLTS